MNPLDLEARADRLLSSMAAMEDLLSGRAPGLPLDAEHIGPLFALITDEARKVIHRHTPLERLPGMECANDCDFD